MTQLLSTRTPLTTASAMTACLCSFAGTPDGAHALVHSARLPAQVLRHLQDGMAARDWRRLGPALQLLAALCCQPEVGGRHSTLQSLVDCLRAASADVSAGQHAAQPQRAAAAAHALWALVHGSGGERAKAALRRCKGWEHGLREGLAAAEREPQASWAAALTDACSALHRLLA